MKNIILSSVGATLAVALRMSTNVGATLAVARGRARLEGHLDSVGATLAVARRRARLEGR